MTSELSYEERRRSRFGISPPCQLQPVCASRNVLLARDISLVEAKNTLFWDLKRRFIQLPESTMESPTSFDATGLHDAYDLENELTCICASFSWVLTAYVRQPR